MTTENELYKLIGQRIKRMREQLNLSQDELAERMDYRSAATISHFESGIRKVSIADIQKLATIFGVPLDSLVAEEKRDSLEELQHFRLRAQSVKPDAQNVVAEFLSFAYTHAKVPTKITIEPHEQRPGKVATNVLKHLDWQEPPVLPREVAKRLGVPVFEWDFPDEISGIFAPINQSICIGVNRYHPYVRQNFTIAHELGHWLYESSNQKTQIDFSQVEILASSDEESASEERKANQFAADLLMPMSWIQKDYMKNQDLPTLANRYQVSEQALWYRLVTLKLVTKQPSS